MLHFTNEHFSGQEQRSSSEKRLLVGIDAPLSAETRYAVDTLSEFVAPYAQRVQVLLLHVIVVPYVGGRYAPRDPFPPTPEEQKQGVEALQAAYFILQEHGIPRLSIEALIRVGSPAEELVKVATTRQVDCLIVGRRRPPPVLGLRRLLMGNISHDVLHKASCPVMVVTLPRVTATRNIVAWYEAALQQALQEHPSTLVNLTASEVMAWFPPPYRSTLGRQERRAAEEALEHLACSGVLYRQRVQREMHYLSD